MENKEKKKYVVPEAEVVNFASEDIILTSLARGLSDPGFEDEDWEARN